MRARLLSKSGCLKCRARRKKCDEQRPICNNCAKVGLSCIWLGSDKVVTHFIHSGRILSAIDISLRMQDEKVNFAPGTFESTDIECPQPTISAGYLPLRSFTEHRLLGSLHAFLNMIMSPTLSRSQIDHSHTFAAGLEHLWVRDALVAFAAFIASARHQALRTLSYQHYNISIRQIQANLRSPNCHAYKEELLIATLFMGLFEVNNPENNVLPVLHFEAVGHLLDQVAQASSTNKTKAKLFFHRVALESYLYHVSMLSLYYPQTDRFPQLSHQVEKCLNLESSGFDENLIVALDINVYRVLFALTVLGRQDPSTSGHEKKIKHAHTMLNIISRRATSEMHNQPQTQRSEQFWRLTFVASETLCIFLAKIRNRNVLPGDENIQNHVRLAVETLKFYDINRAWTGNFVWILTILLCAAYTTPHNRAIHQIIERVKQGIWGADLSRLKTVVRKVQAKRKDSLDLAQQTDGVLRRQEHDTLALLLRKEGFLADMKI